MFLYKPSNDKSTATTIHQLKDIFEYNKQFNYLPPYTPDIDNTFRIYKPKEYYQTFEMLPPILGNECNNTEFNTLSKVIGVLFQSVGLQNTLLQRTDVSPGWDIVMMNVIVRKKLHKRKVHSQ